MASKKNQSVNIKKYKKKREMNLGILLFAVVLIYLIVMIISYFTGDQVNAYEVREGSIVRDNSYTGLVIRNETVVNAEADGYVSFYQNENSKVKKGAKVYALTENELDTENTSSGSKNTALSDDIQSGIVLQIQNFNENYKDSDFSSVYLLKNDITVSLQNELSQTKTEQLDAVISAEGLDAVSYSSAQDGIVAYTIDGYEGLTSETFTEEDFDRTSYESTVIEDQTYVSLGSPVYKLITDDDWSVIVQLDDETAEELSESETSEYLKAIRENENKLGNYKTFTQLIVERAGKNGKKRNDPSCLFINRNQHGYWNDFDICVVKKDWLISLF